MRRRRGGLTGVDVAALFAVPPRLLGLDELPWRTRARLWCQRRIDLTGAWLCDRRGGWRWARWLWIATGGWR